MNLCKFCKNEVAIQTGSHIVTSWLIVPLFSQGKNTRGNEVIFNFSHLGTNKIPYFGRNVSPETILKVIGKTLSDDDVLESKEEQKFIYDNLYCRECERRFAIVESAYKKYHDKIITNHAQCFKVNENLILRLFLYIQLWRVSNDGKSKFILPLSIEKKMHTLLQDILISDKDDFESRLEVYANRIKSFPMTIMIFSTDTKFQTVFFNHLVKNPIVSIIGNYLVILHDKNVKSKNEFSCFGLEKIISNELVNFQEDSMNIYRIDNEKFENFFEKFKTFILEKVLIKPKLLFKMCFNKMFGRNPNEYEKTWYLSILYRYSENGRYLENENLQKSLIQFVSEYNSKRN